MTTVDFELSAELVCSTERARRAPKKSRNALRTMYVAFKVFNIFCSGYPLAANSIATQSWLLQKTRPLKLNSAISFLYSAVSVLLFYDNSSFSTLWLQNYIYIQEDQNNNTQAVQRGTKEGKAGNSQNTEDCFYGKPIWKTGAAWRSHPLRRNFPWEAGVAEVDAKLASSTKCRFGGLAGGLETSNLRGNFLGLR